MKKTFLLFAAAVVLSSCATTEKKAPMQATQIKVNYVQLGNNAFDNAEYAKAFSYYQSAENITDPTAQKHLGDMYLNGAGVSQDYEKAAEWF